MAITFQPRHVFAVAALGLAVASGCQGGVGRFVPDFEMPSIFARGNERKARAADEEMPTAEVTQQNFAQVQLALGDSLAKEGNFKAAQAAYEAAIRNDDSLARAYHKLALLHEKTGHGSESKDHFLQAIKLDPKNAEIVCDYGYWCYLRQDWDESLKHFERALKLDPGLKRAHNNLGLVYARSERPDEALKQFTLAGLSPADARANLGFVYLTEQRVPEAKEELQWAATASPNSGRAREVLANLEKSESTEPAIQLTSTDEPKRLPSINPPKRLPVTASTPAPATPIVRQFDLDALRPAESQRDLAISSSPPRASATTRQLADASQRARAAEAPRQATVTSKSSPVETRRPAAITAKTTNEHAIARRTDKHDLPTQHVAPILSDYPLGDSAWNRESVVELTDFAEQSPAESKVKPANVRSNAADRTIRFLPGPADPPPGA